MEFYLSIYEYNLDNTTSIVRLDIKRCTEYSNFHSIYFNNKRPPGIRGYLKICLTVKFNPAL